jgi:hypothetical protein
MLGRASGVAAACAVLLMVASLAQNRYTERRAQRLSVVHEDDQDGSTLNVYGADYVTPRAALASDSAMHPAQGEGERPLHFVSEAAPTGFLPPSVEVVGGKRDGAADSRRDTTRTLTLRVRAAGAYRISMRVPRSRLAGWRMGAEHALPLPAMRGAAAPAESYVRLDWVAPPDSGLLLALTLSGSEPVVIHAAASRYATTPAAAALMRTLPPWTDSHSVAVTGTWWKEP